jgi:hypothetical protein
VLALPDRHLALESLEAAPARRVSRRAVRRGDGDHHARFARQQLAEPVEDGEPRAVLGGELGGERRQALRGERTVRGVGEAGHRAALVVVAHRAEEEHHRTTVGAGHRGDRRGDVERLLGQSGERRAAAGDRWQERHLDPVAQRRGVRRQRAVDGHRDPWPQPAQRRMRRGEPALEVADRGVVR